jgi:putative CocE/NonD family hydrolase
MEANRLILVLISLLIISCAPAPQDETLMIPMRDGVKLSTQILFPQVKQKQYPVVLLRTPYKKERRVEQYNYLVANGYVLVLQDVRGRFGSEGIFEPFVNEGKDGYDAIEWIAQQAWCDGNIGMIGSSYNGLVQFSAAAEQAPQLKTIIPNVAMADPFYNAYQNGIFTPASLMWCAIIEAIGTNEEIYRKDWAKLLDHQPLSELDSIALSKKLDYYQQWVQHDSKDEYWKQGNHLEKLKEIKIPVFLQSGWFDTQLHSSKLAYNALKEAGNQNLRMIIGPWGHTDEESKFYEGEFMGEAADDINLQTQYLRWLDYWLKGKDNGMMEEPLIQRYALNSNKWYSDQEYPFSYTTDKKLFLSSHKHPELQAKSGALILDVDQIQNRTDTFIYDPENVPVFTEEMLARNKFDLYREVLKARKDYLFYKTAPLEAEKTILGQISARIYASSSAVDTDWFALLAVLDDQDKFIDLISFGALRARFRNSFEKSELLEKDKVYPFDIHMNQSGLKVAKGHKLALNHFLMGISAFRKKPEYG